MLSSTQTQWTPPKIEENFRWVSSQNSLTLGKAGMEKNQSITFITVEIQGMSLKDLAMKAVQSLKSPDLTVLPVKLQKELKESHFGSLLVMHGDQRARTLYGNSIHEKILTGEGDILTILLHPSENDRFVKYLIYTVPM